MKFKYVRIQGREVAANTNYARGIFSMSYKLIQDEIMDEEDADLFKEIINGFQKNFPIRRNAKDVKR